MRRFSSLLTLLAVALAACAGCQTTTKPAPRTSVAPGSAKQTSQAKARKPRASRGDKTVRKVVCLYDHKPWFSNDVGGDRDPEGVRFRVFLKNSENESVLSDGQFNVDIYRVEPGADGAPVRKLIGDYRYPSSQFSRVGGGLMGDGYLMQFNWSDKATPGHEIEIVTTFEDPQGQSIRAETKRLKVPKFSS